MLVNLKYILLIALITISFFLGRKSIQVSVETSLKQSDTKTDTVKVIDKKKTRLKDGSVITETHEVVNIKKDKRVDEIKKVSIPPKELGVKVGLMYGYDSYKKTQVKGLVVSQTIIRKTNLGFFALDNKTGGAILEFEF